MADHLSLSANGGRIRSIDLYRILHSVLPPEIILLIYDYHVASHVSVMVSFMKHVKRHPCMSVREEPFMPPVISHKNRPKDLSSRWMDHYYIRPSGRSFPTYSDPREQYNHDVNYMLHCPYQKYRDDCPCLGVYKHQRGERYIPSEFWRKCEAR